MTNNICDLSFTYLQNISLEFRRLYKRKFYAAMYGNNAAMQEMKDFMSMYLMGGEL